MLLTSARSRMLVSSREGCGPALHRRGGGQVAGSQQYHHHFHPSQLTDCPQASYSMRSTMATSTTAMLLSVLLVLLTMQGALSLSKSQESECLARIATWHELPTRIRKG